MSRLNEIKNVGGNWTLHMIDNKFLKLRTSYYDYVAQKHALESRGLETVHVRTITLCGYNFYFQRKECHGFLRN